jgi:hypothetical protein
VPNLGHMDRPSLPNPLTSCVGKRVDGFSGEGLIRVAGGGKGVGPFHRPSAIFNPLLAWKLLPYASHVPIIVAKITHSDSPP